MEQNYSLLKILRNDPDFAGALAKKTEDVKKDKQSLLKATENYTKKYASEIEEGTRIRQKLLAEGETKGLSEEEIFKGNTIFYPTKYTPILNFLYFMFRDEVVDEKQKLQELTENYIREFGYENLINALKEGIDDKKEVELEDILSANTQVPEDSSHFVYGSMDHETYKKIKKLKRLSNSPNPNEAALAYKKCREMCDKYDLDFYKIVV